MVDLTCGFVDLPYLSIECPVFSGPSGPTFQGWWRCWRASRHGLGRPEKHVRSTIDRAQEVVQHPGPTAADTGADNPHSSSGVRMLMRYARTRRRRTAAMILT